MKIKQVSAISAIGKSKWNAISGTDNPFLRYEFLAAMEAFDCVGEKAGWLPHHFVVSSDDDRAILAIMPMYKKYNSYGELVFDWSWADAYRQVGRSYYPKLVSAIPYTPATGERVLFAEGVDEEEIRKSLLAFIVHYAESENISSIHCLFPQKSEASENKSAGFMTRLGCQFHWQNQNYESLEHYLSHFNARKRKNVLKERKKAQDSGVKIQILQGDQVEPDLWPIIYDFYSITFWEKGGIASFTQDFFIEIAKTMGEQLLIILAIYDGRYVAGAICYQSNTHLYGRHWGSLEKFHSLHFEVCYYQGLEYAINQQLQVFEPGAQGEHKISRGFLPQLTYSSHWIKDDDFRVAIRQFIDAEAAYVMKYKEELNKTSPFKVIDL